jgi:hypothetical protein
VSACEQVSEKYATVAKGRQTSHGWWYYVGGVFTGVKDSGTVYKGGVFAGRQKPSPEAMRELRKLGVDIVRGKNCVWELVGEGVIRREISADERQRFHRWG